MTARLKVLVCGGRNFADWDLLSKILLSLDPAYIVTGANKNGGKRTTKGADKLAKIFADSRGITCDQFDAEWDQYGKAAGPIRNQIMLDESRPDLVVCFPGGEGTAHMKFIASSKGVEVLEVMPDGSVH